MGTTLKASGRGEALVRGERVRVTEAGGDRIRIAFDDGGTRSLTPRTLFAHLDYSYAGIAHKVQGETSAVHIATLDRNKDLARLYVSVTRGRDRTVFVADARDWLTDADLSASRHWLPGISATVPLPRPLRRRLVILAEQRLRGEPMPMPAGRLLFRRPIISPGFTNSIGVLDNNNFHRDVWNAAREAAGLVGDKSLPALDPRRNAMKINELRAFSASVLLYSGSSLTEAALLLRHADKKTTQRH